MKGPPGAKRIRKKDMVTTMNSVGTALASRRRMKEIIDFAPEATRIRRIVLPALDPFRNEPEVRLGQERRYRLLLHQQSFSLVHDLRSCRRILFLIGLLHQRIEFGVFEMAVVEGLVGAEAQCQEVLGIGVIGDPAGTRDVELAALLQVGIVRRHVEIHQRDLGAEGVLPHVGDRRRDTLMVGIGVVADFDVERLAALAVTGFLHQLDRLVLAVELRHVGKVGLGGIAVALDARRDHRIGRQLRTAVDFLGKEVAVDRHRKCPADADIAIGLLAGVESVVVGGKRRGNVHLLSIGRAQALDLVGGEVVGEIHFLRFETTDRGRLIVDRIEDHLVELDIGGIPIIGVLLHRQAVVRHMRRQLECAIRNHHTRFDEVRAVLFDARLADRKRRLVCEQFQEEGRRPFEGNLQGLFVDGLYAELVDRHFALVDLFGVLDREEDVGVFGRGLRILHAAEGEGEILCRHRRSVRPLGIGTQFERVDGTVVRKLPGFGGARNDLARGIVDRQAFIEVLEDELLDVDGGVGLVERLRFAGIAAVKYRLGERGACPDEQRAYERSGPEIEFQ